MTYLSSKMAVAKEIANNPNIPKGAKMQLLLKENAKIKAAQEAELRFKSSSQYANLPTAEEKAEETEEKRAELRGEPEKEEAAIRAEEEKDREESPGTQEGEHVPEEVPEQREFHVSAAEKEIHWIDLRDAAESPRTEREYVREAYRREMEAETNTEFREKNRGKH